MSFRTQDDAKLLTEFLRWYDHQTDGGTDEEIVARFIAERNAVSIPSMWDDSPQPKSTITATHKEGDPLLIVKG